MDWMDGLDWIGWLSYTAVTPRASLKSDANNIHYCIIVDSFELASILDLCVILFLPIFPKLCHVSRFAVPRRVIECGNVMTKLKGLMISG